MQNRKFQQKAKIFLFTFFSFFALLFYSCASSSQNSSGNSLLPDSNLVSGTLENGMDYYIFQNSEPKNRIYLRLCVKAGSNAEEDDQRGVAHLVEHMAFNGTKNFSKNSIVHYLESIGMDFGADLNAYTSFDETVYMLEIPADNQEILKNGLLILHDWASGLTFDAEELEKERGVVTEEWRTGLGVNGRIRNQQIPFLYADSRYAERLPIGDMDIIQNVSKERVVDFYKKWYRPELMSVIVVGDAPAETLENAVKQAMQDIPPSEQKTSRAEFSVPIRKNPSVLAIRDSEIPYTTVMFFNQSSYKACKTESDLRTQYIYSLVGSIMNERLSAITNTGASPWRGAQIVSDKTGDLYLFGLGFIPKEGQCKEAFELLLYEYERFLKYGVNESELERQKKSILSSEELYYKNKDKQDSSHLIGTLQNYAIGDGLFLSPDDAYAIVNRIIPSITKSDVEKAAKKLLPNRGNVLFATIPENSPESLSSESLKNIWRNYKVQNLKPYPKEVSQELGTRPENAKNFISAREIPELDASEYVLENGVRIITKKTDFNADFVQMYAYSRGGSYLYDEADFPSAKIAGSYGYGSSINGLNFSEMQKILSETTVDFSIGISTSSDWITASSSNADLESLLTLVYNYMAFPQFTDECWNLLWADLEANAKAHGTTPSDVFSDKATELLYGNSIYYSSITEDFLSKIDPEKAEKIYRERFENASDFTFVFVGDMNEEKLLTLCSYYLGNLPSNPEQSDSVNPRTIPFPKGTKNEVVYKGLDEQAKVFIAFGTELPAPPSVSQSWIDDNLMDALSSLLEIKLRENLREDKSGTYGVGVYGGIYAPDENSPREVTVQIQFSCEPIRTKELIAETFSTIADLQKNGVDEETLTKLRENYKRSKEDNLRRDGWWLHHLLSALVVHEIPISAINDFDTIPKEINSNNLKNVLNRYCALDNYVTLTLLPESMASQAEK